MARMSKRNKAAREKVDSQKAYVIEEALKLVAENQQQIDDLVRQAEERDKKSGLSDRYHRLAADLQRAMS